MKNNPLIIIAAIILISSCSSNTPNNPPEINLDSLEFEGAELSQISIESNAIDKDGTRLNYEWVQRSGTSAALNGADTETLSIILPDVLADEVLSFSIKVTDNNRASSSQNFVILVRSSLADNNPISSMQVEENDENISVFISSLNIDIDSSLIKQISFEVEPKTNAASDPFKVSYLIENLATENGIIKLPIYALYDNYENTLNLSFKFNDNSVNNLSIKVSSGAFKDARNVYDNVETIQSSESINKTSYSYIFLKSAVRGPVIMDIDGSIRWVGSEDYDSSNSTYLDGIFYTTLNNNFITHSLADNKTQQPIYQPSEYSDYTGISTHHNIEKGKSGLLIQITAYKDEIKRIESVIWEIDFFGNVIKEWAIGEILEAYMTDEGDNASDFVRHGSDWCHTNSTTYQESDDSLLVSCREDFVIKLDYSSGKGKWVFGDETKYWYTFPSLIKLSLFSQDTKPIGQHSLSIVNDELMLFNNGFFSMRQPDGVSRGISLATSRGARYLIDEQNKSADLVWEYDPGLYSDVCSSIYKDSNGDGDYLVNFAAINRTNGLEKKIILQGINNNKELLFEYHLLSPEPPCITSWNAEPISDFTNLLIN